MPMPISFLDVMDSVKLFGVKGAFTSDTPGQGEMIPRKDGHIKTQPEHEQEKQFESGRDSESEGH